MTEFHLPAHACLLCPSPEHAHWRGSERPGRHALFCSTPRARFFPTRSALTFLTLRAPLMPGDARLHPLSPNGTIVGGEGRVRGQRRRLFLDFRNAERAKIRNRSCDSFRATRTLTPPPHPTLSPEHARGRGLKRCALYSSARRVSLTTRARFIPLSPNGTAVGGEGRVRGWHVRALWNFRIAVSLRTKRCMCCSNPPSSRETLAPPPHPTLSPEHARGRGLKRCALYSSASRMSHTTRARFIPLSPNGTAVGGEGRVRGQRRLEERPAC